MRRNNTYLDLPEFIIIPSENQLRGQVEGLREIMSEYDICTKIHKGERYSFRTITNYLRTGSVVIEYYGNDDVLLHETDGKRIRFSSCRDLIKYCRKMIIGTSKIVDGGALVKDLGYSPDFSEICKFLNEGNFNKVSFERTDISGEFKSIEIDSITINRPSDWKFHKITSNGQSGYLISVWSGYEDRQVEFTVFPEKNGKYMFWIWIQKRKDPIGCPCIPLNNKINLRKNYEKKN